MNKPSGSNEVKLIPNRVFSVVFNIVVVFLFLLITALLVIISSSDSSEYSLRSANSLKISYISFKIFSLSIAFLQVYMILCGSYSK